MTTRSPRRALESPEGGLSLRAIPLFESATGNATTRLLTPREREDLTRIAMRLRLPARLTIGSFDPNQHRSETEQEASRASRAGPFVRLTVDDTGSGTPRDAWSRVSAQSRTPIESTREPGLSAVRAAVRQLSGVLRVERRDGGGTRVSVFIPLAGHSTV